MINRRPERVPRDSERTVVSQPKSKPPMLTPAQAIPAATVRPTLRATIDPTKNEVYMMQLRRKKLPGCMQAMKRKAKGG